MAKKFPLTSTQPNFPIAARGKPKGHRGQHVQHAFDKQSNPAQTNSVLGVAGVDDERDFVSFGNNGCYRTQPKFF